MNKSVPPEGFSVAKMAHGHIYALIHDASGRRLSFTLHNGESFERSVQYLAGKMSEPAWQQRYDATGDMRTERSGG